MPHSPGCHARGLARNDNSFILSPALRMSGIPSHFGYYTTRQEKSPEGGTQGDRLEVGPAGAQGLSIVTLNPPEADEGSKMVVWCPCDPPAADLSTFLDSSPPRSLS
jgi:hypothetical protein